MKNSIAKAFYHVGSIASLTPIQKVLPIGSGILMYHRILPASEMQNNFSGITVSLEMFERQLKWLSNNKQIISLDTLISLKDEKQICTSVVLTFDDGYKDNLTYALPLLEKYKAPATIYITNRFYKGDSEMWWEELNHILLSHKKLNIEFQNKRLSFELNSPSQVDKSYKTLRALFVSLNYGEQKKLLSVLRGQLNPLSFNNLILDSNEIEFLSKSPLITIGAHTTNHVVLSRQSEEESFTEMTDSRKDLENLIKKEVKHFAYPFGSLNEVSAREIKLAEKAGFKTATTTTYGLWQPSTNAWEIPRIAVKNRTDEVQLEVKLSGFNSFFRGIQI